LLGLHGSGGALTIHSGFNGIWGNFTDINVVNNKLFFNLLDLDNNLNGFKQITAPDLVGFPPFPA
jgi:hypothetical protein